MQSCVYQDWLSVLLDCRGKGDSIPGASGMIGESGATAAALNALKAASKDIKCSPHHHYHLMLYVGDKILALYSRWVPKFNLNTFCFKSTLCVIAFFKFAETISAEAVKI